jgi:hypothetical protein
MRDLVRSHPLLAAYVVVMVLVAIAIALRLQ